MPKKPKYPTPASFASAEADPADPNVWEKPDLYTPEEGEDQVMVEFIEDVSRFAYRIEKTMGKAGFTVSGWLTEDEVGPKHVVNIIGDSSTLNVEKKVEYPKARIERRRRPLPAGGTQEVTYVDFATSFMFHQPGDVSFRISSRRGWIKWGTEEIDVLTDPRRTFSLLDYCRLKFDSAMEEYLPGE